MTVVLPQAESEIALFEHWDRVRAVLPVGWSPDLGAHVVSSYESALEVFDHPDLRTDAYEEARPSPLPLLSSFELDPEASRRLHLAVTSCIGRRVLPMDIIGSGCADLVAATPRGRPIDFAGSVAEPIAKLLVRRWFGLDEATFGRLLALFAAARSDSAEARRAAARRLLVRILLELVVERREAATGDLLSRLAEAWTRQELHDEWLVAFIAPMLNSLAGGFGGRLITHTALHLAGRPDLHQKVRAGGWQAARQAANEAARLDPVNQALPRRAQRRLRLAGQAIDASERVWIAVPAVCRDPAAYRRPHEFQMDRTERHIAFGHGRHSCSGRELALAVAATAITEIVVHQGCRLSSVPSDAPVFRFAWGRSCVRLPLVFQPEPDDQRRPWCRLLCPRGGERNGVRRDVCRVDAVEPHCIDRQTREQRRRDAGPA